ncbi:flagellar biosynthesis protein FlhA [Oscillospiraceae bacterium LTW-04]|nr:flagellar biosynthesis protein FlhA [Oscillospiraceae bacterium MB24-C1]
MKNTNNIFNNIVAVFIVAIILLLIIPLPTALLDMMFIINLTISFVILLTTMYIKEPLEFSIFPSLLLITTVFRMALTISSTRLILSNNGYAGKVIETFGKFVIRGNVVIGLVIFLIIVIVQFMVITKGSERVAEVAARFTLDAMPGKQMAIDADLNSGLIDESQARHRREKIQRESDFFGSMDGATKFVKGDAIVSIVVTIINLLGGILMGFMNQVGTFGQIMSVYSTATVGDGLMSQIPALLISMATGMIVTRSASESNLNIEVVKQFLSQPVVLILSGCVMFSLSFIGFPPLQIVLVSVILISTGTIILRKQKTALITANAAATATPTEEVASEASFYKNIDNVYGLLNVEPIELEFGYSLIPLVDEASGGSFIDRVVMFRKQFAIEMGMVIPSVRLKDSGQLNPNQYSIKFKGERIAIGDVLIDHYLALAPDNKVQSIDGIDTIEPAFGIPAKWISLDKKIKAELAGYTLIDPTSVIITHLSEVIRQHAYELLTRQEVNNLLANLRKTNETIINDIIPGIVSVSTLQKVLCNLLREGVPIRDLETILEVLGDYGASIKDADMLTEYVRQSLKRTISHQFAEAEQLKVITLDAKIENMIMGAVKKLDTGSYLALDPATIQSIISASGVQIDKIRELVPHSVILTSPIVRMYYKKLIDQFYPNVIVLSFSEIDSTVQIQALGNITIS